MIEHYLNPIKYRHNVAIKKRANWLLILMSHGYFKTNLSFIDLSVQIGDPKKNVCKFRRWWFSTWELKTLTSFWLSIVKLKACPLVWNRVPASFQVRQIIGKQPLIKLAWMRSGCHYLQFLAGTHPCFEFAIHWPSAILRASSSPCLIYDLEGQVGNVTLGKVPAKRRQQLLDLPSVASSSWCWWCQIYSPSI